MDIDVLDMFRNLFGSDEMREAMIADPEATMREQGIEPPAEAEWQEAMEQLRSELGAEYETTIAQIEARMAEWEELRDEAMEMGEPPAFLGDMMVMGDGDAGWHCMVGGMRVPVMPEPETGGWEMHHPDGRDIGFRPATGEHYTRTEGGGMEWHEEPPHVEPWEGGHHEPPPAYGEHPVHGNPHDGYTVIIEGEEHQLRYDAERGWEYRAPDSGWVGHGEGGYYHHGPEGTQWVDDHHDAHHRPPHDEHGKPHDEHEEPEYGKPHDEHEEPEYGKPHDEHEEPEYGKPHDEHDPGYEPELPVELPVDEYGRPIPQEPEYGKPHDEHDPGYEPELPVELPVDEYGRPIPQEPEYGKPHDEHDPGYEPELPVELPVDEYGRPIPQEPEYGKPHDEHDPGYEEPEYAKPVDDHRPPQEEHDPGYEEPEYAKPVDEYTPAVEPEYAPPAEEHTPPVEEYTPPVEDYAPPVEEYAEIVEMPVDDYVEPVQEAPAHEALPPEPQVDMAPVDDMAGGMMDDA